VKVTIDYAVRRGWLS